MHRRLTIALLALATLGLLLPAASADDCHFYYDSTPTWIGGEQVCAGYSPYGCTECTRWTSPASVQSCIGVGEGSCFYEENQN